MNRPISRRRALQLGGLGLVATAVGGAGLTRGLVDRSRSAPGDAGLRVGASMTEPTPLRSTDGVLQLLLEASQGPVDIAGQQAVALRYNGSLPGPTLHLAPGDRLRIRLVNRLDAPTNLHVHGLHVSPVGAGDDPFVMVPPGGTHDYDYQLPDDHPPGVCWYHPHHHGTVADQIFGGLYGAIVVADPAADPTGESRPATLVTRERVLVVSDLTLDDAGQVAGPTPMARMAGREGELVLVNGRLRPELIARPGERERWRVVNACVARYLRLTLDGQDLQLLGIDAGRFATPAGTAEVVLAPGNRADVLVTTRPGTSALAALPFDRGGMAGMGMMGDGMGGGRPRFSTEPVELAVLRVSGAPVASLPPVPSQAPPRDVRGATVSARRRLTLSMGMGMMGGGGGMGFMIDGQGFDAARVDQVVRAGAVEEWTFVNTSPMNHPMHLHVWPMQVLARDGEPVDGVAWQDVVDVPAHGEVTVRIPFEHITGRTVYHCHILDHEDNGMMGVVEVT